MILSRSAGNPDVAKPKFRADKTQRPEDAADQLPAAEGHGRGRPNWNLIG